MKKRMASLAIVALVAALAAGAFLVRANSTHAASGAISIKSDSDFTACGCVASGSGTTTDPYIIGPLAINNGTTTGVLIDGTNLTKSFVLYNLSVAGNSGGATGIILQNINTGSTQIVAKILGKQTIVQKNNIGIQVFNSHHITLDGAGENSKGWGIGETGAGTINSNNTGAINVENSSDITIEGWQLSTDGPSSNPNWVTLDPSVSQWAVGGVRFFNVTGSLIDHNSANNTTDVSYSLFDSSHDTISNNTADYPFTMNYLIADGSTYNTITGNEGSTGDFIGLMVADPLPGTWTLAQYGPTHDNTISGNTIHTNGPTGSELNPVSIAPAFLGGLVVLNGTYNNTIENNQTWGSFGSDLAWAQAVPSSTTPIGVATYPPTLHCNVTASEGGGGVANLNGNVWKGNTFQIKDPCIPAQ